MPPSVRDVPVWVAAEVWPTLDVPVDSLTVARAVAKVLAMACRYSSRYQLSTCDQSYPSNIVISSIENV